MRKHRLFGVVIAALLIVGAFLQQPGTTNQATTGLALSRTGLQIPSAGLPAGVHPAVVHDTDLPQGFLDQTTTPQTGDALVALTSLLTPAPTPAPTTTTTTAPVDPAPTTTTTSSAPPPAPTTTTTTAPTPPPAPPTPAPATTAPAPAAPAGGVWAELRNCESGGNYADNTGNGYYGAYQFSEGTWQSLGFSGLPSDAPPAVQDQAAQELQAQSGWGQWPSCSEQLGL